MNDVCERVLGRYTSKKRKKKVVSRLKLDDVSNEARQFTSYNICQRCFGERGLQFTTCSVYSTLEKTNEIVVQINVAGTNKGNCRTPVAVSVSFPVLYGE